MSRIDELIAEYCPNGVEYKELRQIANIGTGNRNGNEGIENGKYPLYVRSKFIKTIDTFDFDEEAIIIPGEGGIGEIFHYINGKYALHQRAYRISLSTEQVQTKFIYYYIMSHFKAFIYKLAVNATVSSIRKPMIEKFPIPVPPLPVQEEIVKILDQFTALEAELEAELEARTRQYEYYRNQLLSFEGEEVEWKTLGELYDFKNGLNKGKEFFGKGTPIVNFTDVFKNTYLTRDNLKGLVDVNPIEISRYNAKANDLFFTRTSETREEIGMASVLLEDVENCVFSGFVLRARPKTKLHNPKFISYYMTIYKVRNEIIRHSSFTTRGLTSGPKLSKIKIPVPSLEEQERIVKILDQFEALVTSASSATDGIPAEIKARRQQYEYYRAKLLSFQPLSVA